MKKILTALLATAIVATPVLAAAPAEAQVRHTQQTVRYNQNGNIVVNRQVVQRQNPRAFQRQQVRQQRQVVRQNRQAVRQWQRGQRFDRSYAPNYRVVNDWRTYQNRRLYAPPRGQQWVRSGNDAVLVAVASGLIGAVLGGAFN